MEIKVRGANKATPQSNTNSVTSADIASGAAICKIIKDDVYVAWTPYGYSLNWILLKSRRRGK